ncbi:DUF5335 family protein [Sulfurihydrogenibium sp. YO3AOP1]|uniref:DUF5335 family protein n=1 Tax=Sulfurihydrogenibium sp. (strain YO3AOP1) TaxID=436114 RepID=UPI002483158E|nr:DUF5335 family protein [Sulfurihydrogenibium sp. YO3AOP1]
MTMWIFGTVSVAMAFKRFIFIVVLNKKEDKMIKKFDKSQWEGFFDKVSKNLGSKEAMIEVVEKEIGDQVETKAQPLIGLSYDPKDDEFVVTLEKHEHIIPQPKEIAIDEEIDGIKLIEVVEGDGTKHLIRLMSPLALPQ